MHTASVGGFKNQGSWATLSTGSHDKYPNLHVQDFRGSLDSWAPVQERGWAFCHTRTIRLSLQKPQLRACLELSFIFLSGLLWHSTSLLSVYTSCCQEFGSSDGFCNLEEFRRSSSYHVSGGGINPRSENLTDGFNLPISLFRQ